MLRSAFGPLVALSSVTLLPLPALAKDAPETRLVSCGEKSCLMISGRRDHLAQSVSVNGVEIPSDGTDKWRVVLPIETVRALCEPRAKTVEVTITDNVSGRAAVREARLPVGLLGDSSLLDSIEVTAS